MNTRRKLLVAFGAGLLASSPLGTFAQQKKYRIAILSGGSQATAGANVDSFVTGLKELGYVEGKNVSIERRYSEGNLERLPVLAVELVQSRPDVILAMSSFSVQAVRKATTSIPIVMTEAASLHRSKTSGRI